MLKRVAIGVLLSFFIAACGDSSSPTTPTNPPTNPTNPSTPGTAELAPDDIGVTFGDANFDAGYLSYDVSAVNNADVKVDAIRISIKLLDGDTVIDSGDAFFTSGLSAGQKANSDAAFFETESLDAFKCYEYNVQVVSTGLGIVADKDYPGTCG